MTNNPKDYAITIKVRNNYLLQRMRAAGFDSAAEFARACNVSNTEVGKLLNLKMGGINNWEKWRPCVLRIAEYLQCLPEDIIPAQHQRAGLRSNTAEIEASQEEVAALVFSGTQASSPELEMMRTQCAEAIERAIKGLTPRQERILRLRFGIGGGEPKSIEEIAAELGISRARLHQIEGKMMRKLEFRDTKRQNRELRNLLQEREIWE